MYSWEELVTQEADVQSDATKATVVRDGIDRKALFFIIPFALFSREPHFI